MRTSNFVAVVVLALAASFTGAATAGAAGDQDFAAQARSAGLTATQISTLQAEAETYLLRHGGKQVALNQIELTGATIRLALPGEAQPRKLGLGAFDTNCDGGAADYRHFCAYQQTGFRGTHIDMYACGTYAIPWTGPGSWDNNQTTGTKARMYNSAGKLIFTTRPAHSQDPNGDWTPVWKVRNC